MAVLIVGIGGFIVLIFGRLPLSNKRAITGKRTRLVGLFLFLPLLILFFLQWAITGSLFAGFSQFDLTQVHLEVLQLPLSLISLLISTIIAYWPVPKQDRYRSGDALADIYPVHDYESLSISQAAGQLNLTASQVQALIDEGTLKTNSRGEIERASLEAFVQIRYGLVFARDNNFDQALDAFDKAVGLNPQSTRAFVLRGKTNLRLGNLVEAYSDFRQTQSLRPDYPEIAALISRAQNALRTKPLIPNSIPVNIRKDPGFFSAILVAALLAILIGISSFMDLANYHCTAYYSCNRVEDTATAITYRDTSTSVAGTASALEYTGTAAIAIPYNATSTQASIQLTSAASPPKVPLPGKLIVAYDNALFTASFTEKKLTPITFADPLLNSRDIKISSFRLTPSHTHIVITSAFGVYLANADGSNPVKIANEKPQISPVLSPDEKLMALPDTSLTNIYILDLNGRHDPQHWRHLVGVSPGGLLENLRWSTDGKSLSYCYLDAQGSNAGGVYSVNIDNPAPQLLETTNFGCSYDWSPDRTQVAYTKLVANPIHPTTGDPDWEIVTGNIDGSNPHVLFWSSGRQLTPPIWSPDGKHLVFGRVVGLNASAFVIEADGTNIRIVNPDADNFEIPVDWQP